MSHEFAHIASALPFAGSFDSNSLLLHIDGGASVSCRSVWKFKNNKIDLLDFGWDITKSAVNNYNNNKLSAWILGMSLDEHLAIPGKLMGLSAWGTFNHKLYKWLSDNNWFAEFNGSQQDFIELVPSNLGYELIEFSTKNSFCQDTAFCFQKYFEDTIQNYILSVIKKYGCKTIYYSGGAALNIVTNSKIDIAIKDVNLFIPPVASDCGLALGAAAYFSWKDYGQLEKVSPFINSLYPKKYKEINYDYKEIAKKIFDGKIIGIIHGNSEIGPRALGHRSFFTRPDSVSLKIKISEQIKQREWYRPVAPIILKDNAAKMLKNFNIENNLSKYMLGCWEVKNEYKEYFKGVIHADNTVRAQVIDKNSKELSLIYSILLELWNFYKIGGVINTSLNIKEKPILHFLDTESYNQLKKLNIEL